MFSFSTENWRRPRGRGRRADGDVRRADRPRDARARRRGRADALRRPPRRGRRGPASSAWSGPRSATAGNDRITLFVAFNYGGRAEIVDAARSFEGELRGGVPRPSVRARDARPRPPDPHQRRAADLELPALAVRLLGARLPRRALARLQPRGVRGGAGRVRARAGAGSGGADAMEGSRPFDSELDFDHRAARSPVPEPPPTLRSRAAARERRRRRRRRPPRGRRSETLARIAWAVPWIAIVVTIAIVGGRAVRGRDDRLRLRRDQRVLPHGARRTAVRARRLRGRRRARRRRLLRQPVPDDDRAPGDASR